jgi:hypothetical protein
VSKRRVLPEKAGARGGLLSARMVAKGRATVKKGRIRRGEKIAHKQAWASTGSLPGARLLLARAEGQQPILVVDSYGAELAEHVRSKQPLRPQSLLRFRQGEGDSSGGRQSHVARAPLL